MKCAKIPYLVLSDIHLGHPLVPTEYIVNNLIDFFSKYYKVISKVKLIYLAGDVTHKQLTAGSDEYNLTVKWLSILVMFCSKHNIKLRILEGTPSHDWGQVKAFSSIIDNLNTGVDYKYIDELAIEYLEDLDIHTLYVPDEWNDTGKKTELDVMALMAKWGIDKVDNCIMHGHFKYQIPMIELDSSHSEEFYATITRYCINIGHVHTSSVNGPILAQGSFDRIAHGEEEDKGGMLVSLYNSGEYEHEFLVNENAYPHKKFDVSNMNTSDAVAYLDKGIAKLVNVTRVMVVVSNSEVSKLLKPLERKYKDMRFTIKKAKKTDIVRQLELVKPDIKPLVITKDNILDLMVGELVDCTEAELAVAKEALIKHM